MSTLISADSATSPTRKNLRIFEMDFRGDPRWERFVSAHPDALIYHHPGWLSALESEYGERCVGLACVDDNGATKRRPAPLLYKGSAPEDGSGCKCRRLSSLPRTPVAGPLASTKKPQKRSWRMRWDWLRSEPGVQLEIKSDIPDLNDSLDALTCTPWRPTYVEELPTQVEGKLWEDFWENLRFPRNCVSCEGCRQAALWQCEPPASRELVREQSEKTRIGSSRRRD